MLSECVQDNPKPGIQHHVSSSNDRRGNYHQGKYIIINAIKNLGLQELSTYLALVPRIVLENRIA